MMSDPGLDALVTFIYTPDTDRAFRFYEAVLGLELVRDEGAARIYRVAGGGYLGVCRESPKRPCRPDGICISLVSDDVDGWYQTLITRGATVEGAPAKLEQYGVYSFFLRDPDGHLIEVQQFDDPNWQKA